MTTIWNDDTSPAELERQLESGDLAAARGLVRAFAADVRGYARAVDHALARRMLAALRSARLFDELVTAGQAVCAVAAMPPAVQLLLAQGLIEQGRITAALELLQRLAGPDSDGAVTPEDLAEIDGLRGRAYKQLYVDADPRPAEPRTHDLQHAIEQYARGYRRDPARHTWHGINYVALLARARRSDPAAAHVSAQQISDTANGILKAVDAKAQAQTLAPWDHAIRAEACLALQDTKRAIEALRAYLAHPQIDAFMVAGTLRQFVEIWQLVEDAPPGNHLLPVLRAALGRLGGRIEVAADLEIDERQTRELERVWGDVGYHSIDWLKTALTRTRTIARIGKDVYAGDGTGFVFDGAWLGDGWQDAKLLLTNAHVVSSSIEVRARYPFTLHPDNAVIAFFGAPDTSGKPVEARVVEELYTSPPEAFDATLLRIDHIPEAIEVAPLAGTAVSAQERVNIMGHPGGLGMTVSLQDNLVVAVHEVYLHYRTPTDPGSSGSPIFNQQWQLVGLHHASATDVDANEGIRIDRLLDALRAHLN